MIRRIDNLLFSRAHAMACVCCLLLCSAVAFLPHATAESREAKRSPNRAPTSRLTKDLEVEIAEKPIEGLDYKYEIRRTKSQRRFTHFARVWGSYERAGYRLLVKFAGRTFRVPLDGGRFRFNLPVSGDRTAFVFEARGPNKEVESQGISLLFTKTQMARAIASEYLEVKDEVLGVTSELGYSVLRMSSLDTTNAVKATFVAPLDVDAAITLSLVRFERLRPWLRLRGRVLSLSRIVNRTLLNPSPFLWSTALGVRWFPSKSAAAHLDFAAFLDKRPIVLALSSSTLEVMSTALFGALVDIGYEFPLGPRTGLGAELTVRIGLASLGSNASIDSAWGAALSPYLSFALRDGAFLGLKHLSLGGRFGYGKDSNGFVEQTSFNFGAIARARW